MLRYVYIKYLIYTDGYKMNFNIFHKTPTTRIQIQISLKYLDANVLVKYEEKDRFNKLCELGCINYNKKWSCPPHSPTYSSYLNGFSKFLLILFNCDLAQFDYVKTEYMKVKTSNSILKSQSDKLSRFLEIKLSGKMLSNGSCRLCKPCSKKVSANSCKNPLKLRYSLESLGLNVEQISQDFFNRKLLWYKTKQASPDYSTVVSGILTNNMFDNRFLKELIYEYYSLNNVNIF